MHASKTWMWHSLVSSNTHTVCVILQSVCKMRLEDTLAEVRRSTGYDGPLMEPSIGLVIDGPTLSMAMSDELVEQFVELCKHCRAVLCCRVTPLQKSAVVKLIRKKLRVMTLAVGNETLELRFWNHLYHYFCAGLWSALVFCCDALWSVSIQVTVPMMWTWYELQTSVLEFLDKRGCRFVCLYLVCNYVS